LKKGSKDQPYCETCKYLLTFTIKLLENHPASQIIYKHLQKDAYLSEICQSINDFSKYNYIIENNLLFKRVYDKYFKTKKIVIVLPDILLQPVIYTLRIKLEHPSTTTTLKSFQVFFYHRRAYNTIRMCARQNNQPLSPKSPEEIL
jgi:hypothetical protein